MRAPTYQNLDLGSPQLRLLLDAVIAGVDGSLALAPVYGDAEPLTADLGGCARRRGLDRRRPGR